MRNTTRTVIVEHTVRHVGEPQKQRDDNLFVVKDHAGLAALRYWLQKRKYNTFTNGRDKNGKPLFGLSWDYELGRFPSGQRDKTRGAVLVLDRKLEQQTAMIILNWMSTETEYGKQWKQAQTDLWKYGKA